MALCACFARMGEGVGVWVSYVVECDRSPRVSQQGFERHRGSGYIHALGQVTYYDLETTH